LADFGQVTGASVVGDMNSRRPVSPAILEGFYTNNRCGYCQHSIQSVGTEHSNTDDTTLENEYLQQLAGRIGSGTRSSFGLSAGQVPPELYDRMIQRNFRRSGDFFYWPLNWSGSCCPQYAIRLPASAFKLNKSQRSVISRFLRFCMETPRTTAEKTTAMDTIDETCAKTKDCSDELCDRLVDALREAIQSANLPQIPDTPFDKIHVKVIIG
jgi:arginyl-tRNA--protein-N-Asp/Glu arginylyltransferase